MELEQVHVEVMVNVEGLRRGWVGQVELTERIQKLISNGYLRLLGHVVADPPPMAPDEPQLLIPTETPAGRPKRSKSKRSGTTTPAEGGSGNSGDVRLG